MEHIRNVQQNLWQTKLYITNEKEAINKLQDELKGPTKKVNKVAWVVNHKWRALRTKKFSTKDLSEVDKYSQSLDKSRFFDASDKIQESDKYAAFLKYLRDKPSLVAVIFLTEGTKRREHEELSELIHCMFSSLYGFAILPNDEKRIIRVLGDIAKIQIAEFTGKISRFFAKSSAFSLGFRLYIEWSLNTRVYLGELMNDIVMNIIAEPEFLYVDEQKFQERNPTIKNVVKIRTAVEVYRQRIAQHVISMVVQIRRHIHSFPPYLRWLGVSIVQHFRTYHGATQDQINNFLGELFFTRMLFFPFLQPQIFLSNKIEVVDLANYNLVQVTHAFRDAFLTELGIDTSKRPSASVLPYLSSYSSEMVLLLEELVDVPYSSTVIPTMDIPVHRSAVMITERDLHRLISMLMEVLGTGQFQPEEKEMLATALSLLPSEPTRNLSKRRPGRRATSQPLDRDKSTKRNRPALPDDFVFEEEILVFSLPDVKTDKLKTESQVLGRNIDKEADVVFDQRKMSVLLTSEHPLEAAEEAAQDDIRGRLLQDFDLLFHNPSLELTPDNFTPDNFTPDGVSLSSATSCDSLDRQPAEDPRSNESQLSPLPEGPADTLTPGDSLIPPPVDIPSDKTLTDSEEIKTPRISDTGTSFVMDGFERGLPSSAFSEPSCSSHEYSTLPGTSLQGNKSSVFVNMNSKTGGFFFESQQSMSGDTLHRMSGASNMNSISRFATGPELGCVLPDYELPIDIITSEYMCQKTQVQPALSDKDIVNNAVNKLKIAFALSPHFYKSYYPKIGSAGPATTIDLISLSPSSGTTALVLDDETTSEHKQLLEYLHSEYSDASIHNSKNAVQLEQAIIAIRQLPPHKLPLVISKLEEYNSDQTTYVHYLTERKCELLRSKEFLHRVQSALEIKHNFFYKTLVTFVIQSFLKGFDEQFREYRDRFNALTMADEQAEVYHEYIDFVTEKMSDDIVIQTLGISHATCDERECQTDDCTAMENHRREVLRFAEINFFNAVFSSAFLPNGEAQKQKDSVFRESLLDLQHTADLNHTDIQIPAKYRYEAPWIPAQRHLALLPAFRSPTGKLGCIMDCVFTISKLLFIGAAGQSILDGQITDYSSVPGADDIMPVLIYVIIHANPPNLLSTIDFIDNFKPRAMPGQDQYTLMQFTSAVEFIKSMLHRVAP